jgi:hypothetical protein
VWERRLDCGTLLAACCRCGCGRADWEVRTYDAHQTWLAGRPADRTFHKAAAFLVQAASACSLVPGLCAHLRGAGPCPDRNPRCEESSRCALHYRLLVTTAARLRVLLAELVGAVLAMYPKPSGAVATSGALTTWQKRPRK